MSGTENKEKITIAVHLYPSKYKRDQDIHQLIENRNKNKYPYCRDYILAAIEAFEKAEEEQPVTLSMLKKELSELKESMGRRPMLP